MPLPVPLHREDANQIAFESVSSADLKQGKRSGLPVDNPTKSFWTHGEPGCNPLARHGSEEPLPQSVDVCIIGAGITGVSVAYHLAKIIRSTSNPGALQHGRTFNVVILEAREFCSGATGRNGGHLTPDPYHRMYDLANKYGLDEAKASPDLQQYTVSSIVQIIQEYGWEKDVDLVHGGRIELAFSEEELREFEENIETSVKAGVKGIEKVSRLSAEEMSTEYGARYPGFKIDGYNLWPLKFVTKLFKITQEGIKSDEQSSGGNEPFSLGLYTCTPVLSVTASNSSETGGPTYSVQTSRGAILANYIVHATNAYASYLVPSLCGPSGIVPARGQVLATRASVAQEKLWKNSWIGNEGFEYWFPRPSPPSGMPLVILGGGREASGPDFEYNVTDDSTLNPAVSKALREFLPAVFPHRFAAGSQPEMEWSGIMGFTQNYDPVVGLLPSKSGKSREYVSAGFSGHGMPRTFACSEVIAQMIAADITQTEWKKPAWFPSWYLSRDSRLRN